jgi:hypothetical protein
VAASWVTPGEDALDDAADVLKAGFRQFAPPIPAIRQFSPPI